jgi:hypothetical protein
MPALLQEATSQAPAWLQEAEAGAAIFQAVVTPILIAIGGIFAYYRFFKEETYTSRLQPKVSGKAEVRNDTIYLRATVSAQNTGQVSVALDPELTALQVFTRKAGDDVWKYRQIESIFSHHDQAQPGEEIEDKIWTEIPYDGEIGLKMELYVSSGEDVMWLATEVMSIFTKEGGISSDDG